MKTPQIGEMVGKVARTRVKVGTVTERDGTISTLCEGEIGYATAKQILFENNLYLAVKKGKEGNNYNTPGESLYEFIPLDEVEK